MKTSSSPLLSAVLSRVEFQVIVVDDNRGPDALIFRLCCESDSCDDIVASYIPDGTNKEAERTIPRDADKVALRHEITGMVCHASGGRVRTVNDDVVDRFVRTVALMSL